MTSQLDPGLFDFICDFAGEVANGTVAKLDTVEESSPIIVFCESFFEQFFGNALKAPITGFDQVSKGVAADQAEELKLQDGTKETRRIVALFEKFCDLHADVVGGTYGAGSITYQRFHSDYMRRLLRATLDWARDEQAADLTVAVDSAMIAYENAMVTKGW